MTEVNDVPYLDDGLERHLLDVFLPREPEGRPVVLVLHGGGLKHFSKERMSGVSRRLAEKGFGTVTPNYRLVQDAPWPAAFEDCLAAAEWLTAGPDALAGLDVSRTGVLGASAGGFLGQMLAGKLTKERVRCLVSVSGPSEVPRLGSEGPLDLVGPDWPPTLITHNRNDRIVALRHAERLRDALEKAGVPVQAFIYGRPEEDHGIWVPETAPPVFLDFLEEKINGFLAGRLTSA